MTCEQQYNWNSITAGWRYNPSLSNLCLYVFLFHPWDFAGGVEKKVVTFCILSIFRSTATATSQYQSPWESSSPVTSHCSGTTINWTCEISDMRREWAGSGKIDFVLDINKKSWYLPSQWEWTRSEIDHLRVYSVGRWWGERGERDNCQR